jgi:putative SbcD/Mre11-related phosphoesterase
VEDVVTPHDPSQTRSRRVRLATGIEAILDVRRSVFLPSDGILAVADLHLGYSWVQRRRGALMPVTTPDTTASRVAALLSDYRPRHLVILGDLVHQATPQPGVEAALQELARAIPDDVIWTVSAGNHDRDLERLVGRLPRPLRLAPSCSATGCVLHHGDTEPGQGLPETFALEEAAPFHVIGHEHPALRLGDGVATETKVPCFLVGKDVLVVPAFSEWAAGCDIQRQSFLGPIARRTRFHSAYACLGRRILEIPLHPGTPPTHR